MESSLEVDVALSRHAFELSVRFTASPGVTVLFGPSGAGKSTLLDIIAGLVAPSRGRVAIGDRVLCDVLQGISVRTPDRRIGYVFQSLALFPHLSVIDNAVYGVSRAQSATERRAVADSLLARLGVHALADRRPASLSGGERQRVAIARALGVTPELLLLDEPFASLDRPTRNDLGALVRSISIEREIPVVFVTHDQDEAEALGDHVVTIESGRATAEGRPIDVLAMPRRVAAAGSVQWDNQLDGIVARVLEDEGALLVDVGGVSFTTRPADLAPGDAVCVSVRGSDVVLFLDEPGRMSATNRVPGEIVRLDAGGRAVRVTVRAQGIEILAEITQGTARRLNLDVGTPAWAVFKARACHVRRRDV